MPRTVIPPRSHRRVPASTAARTPLPLMMKAGLAAGIALAIGLVVVLAIGVALAIGLVVLV